MNTDKHGIAVVHHWLIQSKSQTQDAMLFSNFQTLFMSLAGFII